MDAALFVIGRRVSPGHRMLLPFSPVHGRGTLVAILTIR
jgi:hypothetical protein